MPLPCAVVWDANIYRGLSDRLFASIQAAEKSRGIVPYAFPYTALELIAHLADPADTSYLASRAAVRRLWDHCHRTLPDGSRSLALCADSERLVAMNLLDITLDDRLPAMRLIAEICERVAISVSHDDLRDLQEGLSLIAEFVSAEERAFVQHLWERAVKGVDPSATSWHALEGNAAARKRVREFAASAEARVLLAKSLVASLGPQGQARMEDMDLIQRVLDDFGTAITFENALLLKILNEGFDLTKKKRPNFFWDQQLAYNVGLSHSLDGLPVMIVTDDGFIRTAAVEAGHGDRVANLPEYLDFLGLPALPT